VPTLLSTILAKRLSANRCPEAPKTSAVPPTLPIPLTSNSFPVVRRTSNALPSNTGLATSLSAGASAANKIAFNQVLEVLAGGLCSHRVGDLDKSRVIYVLSNELLKTSRLTSHGGARWTLPSPC
jgi:hypothetical protein